MQLKLKRISNGHNRLLRLMTENDIRHNQRQWPLGSLFTGRKRTVVTMLSAFPLSALVYHDTYMC